MELKIETVYHGDTRILTILRTEKVILMYFFEVFYKMSNIFFVEISLAIGENDLIFLNLYQQAKNRPRRSKMGPKIDTFCKVDLTSAFWPFWR